MEVDERREEIPGLELVALVHDELLCVVPEEHAKRAAAWLDEIMVSVADTVVNGDDTSPEKRVPIEAETNVCESWGEK